MVLAARPARRVPLARLVQPDPPDLQGLPDQPDLRVLIVRFPVLQAPLVQLARPDMSAWTGLRGRQAPPARPAQLAQLDLRGQLGLPERPALLVQPDQLVLLARQGQPVLTVQQGLLDLLELRAAQAQLALLGLQGRQA